MVRFPGKKFSKFSFLRILCSLLGDTTKHFILWRFSYLKNTATGYDSDETLEYIFNEQYIEQFSDPRRRQNS